MIEHPTLATRYRQKWGKADITGIILVPDKTPPASLAAPATLLTLTAPGGTQTGRFSSLFVTAPKDSWVIIDQLYIDGGFFSQGGIKTYCTIQSPDNARYMTRPICTGHVFGLRYLANSGSIPQTPWIASTESGGKGPLQSSRGGVIDTAHLNPPYSVPIVLAPYESLKIEFFSTLTTTLTDLMFGGTRVKVDALNDPDVKRLIAYLDRQRKNVYPYWLTLKDNYSTFIDAPGVQVASGSSVNSNFTPITSRIFFATAMMLSVIYDGAALVGDAAFELVRVDLYAGGSEKYLNTTQPVTFSCIAGAASTPHYFAKPLITRPNTIIRATFYNLASANNIQVFPTLFGFAMTT